MATGESKKKFNHLAPAIERLFRFVEMIGVTALLGRVVREIGPQVSLGVIFFGTLLAINYLIEPPLEWLAGKFVGEEPTLVGAFGALIIFGLAGGLSLLATPYVGVLAFLIGKTINSSS